MNTLRDMGNAVKMLQHDYKNMNVQSFYERKSKIHGGLSEFIEQQGGKSELLAKLGKIALLTGAVATVTGVGAEMLGGLFDNAANISAQAAADMGEKTNGMLKAGLGLLAGAGGAHMSRKGVDSKIESAEDLRKQVDEFRDKMQSKELGLKSGGEAPKFGR